MFFNDSEQRSFRDIETALDLIRKPEDEDVVGYRINTLEDAQPFVRIDSIGNDKYPCWEIIIGVSGKIRLNNTSSMEEI